MPGKWDTSTKHFSKNRTLRIRSDNPDRRIFLLKEPRDSRDGAAGSDSDHHVRHTAFGLFPDFRAGRRIMSGGIGRIFILIGKITVRNLLAQAQGHRVITAWVVMIHLSGRDNDFSPERFPSRFSGGSFPQGKLSTTFDLLLSSCGKFHQKYSNKPVW